MVTENERVLLLVDDEENILRSLQRLLRRDGYRIFTASGGREGLELLEREPVGVIVSDQRMPEMTGTEFLSVVKDKWPETVRLVLSGYTDLTSITDAINEGAIYKFLTKPWDDELLRRNIREAFAQFELRAENERLSAQLKEANRLLESALAAQNRELDIQHRILRLSRAVLERLPVGVAGIGDDGIVAIANDTFHALLDAPPDGLIGSDVERLPDGLRTICRHLHGGADSFSDRVQLSGRSCDAFCSRLGPSDLHGVALVVVPVRDGP